MKDLRKKRLKLGLSQTALAIKAGMGRYNIGLAENDQRELSKDESRNVRLALKKEGAKLAKSKNKKK